MKYSLDISDFLEEISSLSDSVVSLYFFAWTTVLSNSMKLSHAVWATQDGQLMEEKSDRMWSTGEGNGKPFKYSCLENPMNSIRTP